MIDFSIIIPAFNEQATLLDCLRSLNQQTVSNRMEIIVVDDGSTDDTNAIAHNFQSKFPALAILAQKHQGPGAGRNLAAKSAKGKILIFVDADMEFAPNFVETLTHPILDGKCIGTYSTEELLLNKDNPWAICWNLNFTGNPDKMTKTSDQSSNRLSLYGKLKSFLESVEEKIAPISHRNITTIGNGQSNLPFRAILKSAFLSIGGFSTDVGYTDDWTLAEKLNQLPTPVEAKYYHKNPASLSEIYRQARWIGRGELNTGNIVRKIHAIFVHNLISSLVLGIIKTIKFRKPYFLIFRLVYDWGIMISVLESFISKNTAR